MRNNPNPVSLVLNKIRIILLSLFLIFVASAAVLPQTLTLKIPNGGEDWTVGTNQNITWDAVGVTGIDIDYSTNGGTDWIAVVSSIDASSGTYSWAIPNTETSNALVRISDTSGTVPADQSDAAFTISAATVTYTISTSSSPSEGGTTSGGGVYNNGETATVIATVNTGWTFVNWTEGATEVSTDASYSFTVSANRTLVANFVQNSYTISTSSNPSNGGTTSGGGPYNEGATATVIATPAAGWTFTNWKEGATVVSTSASYSFSVTGNRTLVANFTQNTYTISTSSNPSNGGATSGGGSYNQGATATVIATPAAGWNFVNWTEGGIVQSSNASYSFTVTSNRTLVANFSQLFVVTTSASPTEGGITSGGGTYEDGTSVTVVATANTNYKFLNWTVNGSAVSSNSSYTFNVSGNINLIANFIRQYTISTNANPSNGGTSSGGGVYDNGSSATVTATPNAGWVFLRWSEGGNPITTNAVYTFIVGSDRTLVANFAQQLTVATSANPTNGGTVSGSGTYLTGQLVNVVATPNQGWNFINWTENGAQVSTSKTYSFNITANRNLVANFTQQFAVTTSSNPVIGGTTSGGGTYADGQQATVIATPNQGWIFLNWTEGTTVVSSIPSYTFTVSGNRTLVANFRITSYTITTIANPPGGGTTSGGGSYDYGQDATVVATPTQGWSFVNWTENNTQVSNGASYTFTVTSARTLTANFSLVPVLTIITPNGGENWQSGTQQLIQWNTVNVESVRLEFSTDSGGSWNLIADNLPASTGLYEWTIPDTPSDLCLVKITDMANASVTDASNNLFSILSRLILISPNGGEVWAANTIKQITWMGSGISTLNIDYSTNAGSEWNNITSADASAGTYNWQVPNIVSNQCLIRIGTGDNIFTDISDAVFEIYSSNITLLPGEIAIVGYNFSNDNPNEFAFVVLKEGGIPANTVINFTDRGVFRGDNSLNPRKPAGSFIPKGLGEGDLVYIAPTLIPAGTVISWRIDQAHPDFLWDEKFDPSAIGEQITVFQYDEGIDTSFIFAMNNELVGPEKWQVDLNVSVPETAPFRTNLPPGLTDSVNAIGFDIEVDNRVYIGGDKPTTQELLAAIVNESNWTGDDYITQVMPNINLITSVDEIYSQEIPTGFTLYQNFPNPFNPTSVIRYSVPEENFVILKVYDILGNEIRTLVNDIKKPGTYQIVFEAGDLESGVYFYRMQSADFTATRKLVLVK